MNSDCYLSLSFLDNGGTDRIAILLKGIYLFSCGAFAFAAMVFFRLKAVGADSSLHGSPESAGQQ